VYGFQNFALSFLDEFPEHFICPLWLSGRGVSIHWTGLLDWNTGLDYWTDVFLVFTHVVVG